MVIRCAEVFDALQTPVQAVYSHGDQFYCFVFDDGHWEARKVECGPTNDRFFVIESGLGEGDQIALNPRRYLDQVSLPKLLPEQQQRAVPRPPNMLTETDEGQQRPRADQKNQTPARQATASQQGRGADEKIQTPAKKGRDGQRLRD